MLGLRYLFTELCCTTAGRARAKAQGRSAQTPLEVSVEVESSLGGSQRRLSFWVLETASVTAVKLQLQRFTGVPVEEISLVYEPLEPLELDDDSTPFLQISRGGQCLKAHRVARMHDCSSRWCRFRYRSSASDADVFDQAAEASDIARLVRLLDSPDPVDFVLEPKHPWVADPSTVGALACAHLVRATAAALSEAEQGDADHSDSFNIQELSYANGAISKLMRLLQSQLAPERQAAVLGLRFLLAEPAGAKGAHEAYKLGAIPLLIAAMETSSRAQAAACASALRNIFVLGPEYSRSFVSQGGLEAFVNQLCAVDSTGKDSQLEALEVLLSFQDLLDDAQGDEYGRLASKLGALEKVQSLADASDIDLSDTAHEVLERLHAALTMNGANS